MDENRANVFVMTFNVVMEAEPTVGLMSAISWLIRGSLRKGFASVRVSDCLSLKEPDIWVFSVTVVSTYELESGEVLALKALITGSTFKDAVVTVDRAMMVSLSSLMPPPPPPLARVDEYHLVSADTDPKDVIGWLSRVSRDGEPESVGIEIVSPDWRRQALISRVVSKHAGRSGQVCLGARVRGVADMRGLQWDSFLHSMSQPNKGDLIDRLCAVGQLENIAYDIETIRRYTWVHPPVGYAPTPSEEDVITNWIVYGRVAFRRDAEDGKTHWFLKGAGGQLAVMKAEEDGQVVFVATRLAFGKSFLFVQMPADVLMEKVSALKTPVFRSLLVLTRGGFIISGENVMKRTGFLFA